ncbi:carbohydrate ABC transporter permease [Nocardioides sp. CFH 31398]|uniref:carbohydrate ABC transporter permease n=1 Tax=Nocardioides sp. CFH 31398 TaxID=2919579 RepID=UPI001F05E6B3|nr:carbohydrate ABC transporter permease [Nocardioides sp. CFH 31398]MCH1868527.1 carbohydrate ABC transporter permease [Nocardioides sp. CFH 31398]
MSALTSPARRPVRLPRPGTLVALLLGVVYLVPLLWIVLTALKSDEVIASQPNAIVFTPSLSTFSDILEVASTSVWTSFRVAAAVTVLVLAVAVPAAYALGRRTGPWWARVVAWVLALFLVLQMVPQPMAVIPLYGILAEWQLVNDVWGLVLADVALLAPFAVLLMRPFVLGIPTELYEAAQMDGASGFRTFRSIVLPMLPNGIATVGAIVFIITWGEFIYATTLLTDPAQLPVSGLLAQQTSLYATSWNRLMGLALLTSIPLLVVFLVAKRRLVEGLSVGAVK